MSIKEALLRAKEKNVVVGAHIGFDDIQGFGYRPMQLSDDEVEALVVYQVGALMSFAKSYGLEIEHVRPHGAMYKMAAEDFGFACAVAKAIKKCSEWLIYYGASGDVTAKVGEYVNIPVAHEISLEKSYNVDGTVDFSELDAGYNVFNFKASDITEYTITNSKTRFKVTINMSGKTSATFTVPAENISISAQKDGFSSVVIPSSITNVRVVGTPDEIFTPERIARLYGMEAGFYDTLFGSIELQKPEGKPRVFVIGGGGSGIPFYRTLQRCGVPFAAGILYENDVDFRVAHALAETVVCARAYEPVEPEVEEKATALLDMLSYVVDCGFIRGTYNRCNERLIDKAVQGGKTVLHSTKELSELFGRGQNG